MFEYRLMSSLHNAQYILTCHTKPNENVKTEKTRSVRPGRFHQTEKRDTGISKNRLKCVLLKSVGRRWTGRV